MRQLDEKLWRAYEVGGLTSVVTLRLSLETFNPDVLYSGRLMETLLEWEGFSVDEIAALKANHEMLLLLDGFDSVRAFPQNVYVVNNLQVLFFLIINAHACVC